MHKHKNCVSLRQYFEALRAADQDAVHAALAAQEKATTKSEGAMETRFAGQNEWRQTYGDRDKLAIPREEYAAGIKTLSDKIEVLAQGSARGAGYNAGILAAVGVGSAIAGALIGKVL